MSIDFFPEIEIEESHADAIARGLYAVARADGAVHPGEAALISEFFAATADTPAALGALARAENIEPAALAELLPTLALRQLFVKTALLLAYTDGAHGAGEATLIAEYATALAIDASTLGELETQVKEFLLKQLSHLQNSEGVAAVAKALDVSK